MAVGYLANSFDLINVRDLDLIAQARRYCTRLIVGVFTDEFAQAQSGRRPIVPLVERLALVSHIRGVDHAIVHDGNLPGLDPKAILFTVTGDNPLSYHADSWPLQPARETTSAAVREALQSLRQDHAA